MQAVVRIVLVGADPIAGARGLVHKQQEEAETKARLCRDALLGINES